ncbi:MAG: hypothetical protein ACYCVG_12835, partial [Leptospirillum sp.]
VIIPRFWVHSNLKRNVGRGGLSKGLNPRAGEIAPPETDARFDECHIEVYPRMTSGTGPKSVRMGSFFALIDTLPPGS